MLNILRGTFQLLFHPQICFKKAFTFSEGQGEGGVLGSRGGGQNTTALQVLPHPTHA